MYVILVYDIKCDEGGQKALAHIQNSVFEGELSEAQLLKLKTELKAIIRDDRDSLIVFKSRNEKWLPKEMWGLQEDKTFNFL